MITPPGSLGAGGLGHGMFRHDSVLLDEIDQHSPLAAVLGGIGEEEGGEATVDRFLLLRCLDVRVEQVVRPLHFVPEKQIRLSVVMKGKIIG